MALQRKTPDHDHQPKPDTCQETQNRNFPVNQGAKPMKLLSIDGMPVIDAKKPLKLEVSRDDVKTASKKLPNACAVAKACYRELHAKEVRVHLSRVYVRTNNAFWTRYVTPKSMRTEIIAFDRGGKFVPGVFHMAAPQPSKRLGPKDNGGKSTKPNNKPKKLYAVVRDVRLGPA
jgi:hypothetical protein